MNRYMPIVCSVMFILLVVLPCQALAASITETSAAIGPGCTASGYASTAMGYNTTAGYNYCTAMGAWTTASGPASTAMGSYAEASGTASTAMGDHTTASGAGSTAMGYYTTASGQYSTAMGEGTTASGYASTAMGYHTTANYNQSTAMGTYTTASNYNAISTGEYTVASGWGSVAMGRYTEATTYYSIAMGVFTAAKGINSIVIGMGLDADFKLTNTDMNSFMVGYMSTPYDDKPEFFVIDNGVCIGTKSPKYLLTVNGSAGKPGGGSWSDTSDERLKANIIQLDSREALDKITRLRGVTFEWVHPEDHSEGLKAGILAQELEVVFPDWVVEVAPTDRDKELIPLGEKAKAISFPHDFNAYLIEAIKELKAQNERQQAEIEELRLIIKELRG